VTDALSIGFLSQWFDPEPGATRGLPLAERFVQDGHSVTAVTGFPNYPAGEIYPGYRQSLTQVQTMGDHSIPVVRLPLYAYHGTNPAGRVANFASFWISSRILSPAHLRDLDVLYTYHPPIFPGLVSAAVRRRGGPPFVLHIADLWPQTIVQSGMLPFGLDGAAERVVRRWCKQAYESAHTISVLSNGFKDILVADAGVDPNKIAVIPNWADEQIFSPGPPDLDRKGEWGLGDRFVVMYAGLLGEYQNLEVLIRAAAELQDLDMVFVLVGDGRASAGLRALADELRLTNVRFVGRVPYDEMGGVTQLADVHYAGLRDLDFLRETVPGKIAQVLCAGQIVVGSLAGDAAATVRGAGGFASDTADAWEIAASLRNIYEMASEERTVMRCNARRYYEEYLAMDRGATATLRLLERAADAR